MTFWSFLVVLTGAATLSTQMMRLVYWLDHPARRGRRGASASAR